jgi:hypothetical protein
MARIAYGFISIQSLFNSRVQQVGPKRVFDAVKASAAEYTRVLNKLLAEFCLRSTDAQIQYELPGSGTLQPLDDAGNPKPVQPSGSYKVGFPIQGGGTAWATTRVARALLTVEEANRNTLDAQQKDADWMVRHILAAVYTNTNGGWTYTDKTGNDGSKGLGDIQIQGLANGDAVVYLKTGGTAPTTDNHYLAQANAIDNSNNPFPAIQTELQEHPSNGNKDILVFIPTNLRDSIQGLSSFKEVPVDAVKGGTDSVLQNIPDPGPGSKVLGYIVGTDCWIILWSALPDNYMIAKIRGAAFLTMREYPAEELQGFFPEMFQQDASVLVNNMIRYAGFGVHDRVAACVIRIGNGAYAIPTGYAAPLKV